MGIYEGLFIIRSELKEDDIKNVIKAANEAVVKNGGTIKKEEIWGKRQLAYTVKKHKDGYYYKIDFDIAPSAITKIETVYKLNTDILRVMITRKEEKSA